MAENKSEAVEKPGYKTSEFWLTLAVVMLGILMASGAFGDDHIVIKVAGMAVATLKALGYDASRAKTKFGASVERSGLGKSQE